MPFTQRNTEITEKRIFLDSGSREQELSCYAQSIDYQQRFIKFLTGTPEFASSMRKFRFYCRICEYERTAATFRHLSDFEI